jgi:hypothetical protein
MTLTNFLPIWKEKNKKKEILKNFDLKKCGISLFLLNCSSTESNKLPWGQIFPHQ